MKRKKLIYALCLIAAALIFISSWLLCQSTRGKKYNPYVVGVVQNADYEIALETERFEQETPAHVEESIVAENPIIDSSEINTISDPDAATHYKTYEELEEFFYKTFRYQMIWAFNKKQDSETGDYVVYKKELDRLNTQEETIKTWAASKSQELVGDGKTEKEAEEILYTYVTNLGSDMSAKEQEILSLCGSLAHLFRALIEHVTYTPEGVYDFTSGTKTDNCQIALSGQAVWTVVNRMDGSIFHYDPAFGTDAPDSWKQLLEEEITKKDGYHAEYQILH